MEARARLSLLQVPVVVLGVLLMGFAAASMVTLPPPPAGGDGLPGGLAVLFLYVVLWVGFVVLAIGLAVPGDGRWAVAFSRGQRRLFLLAAGAAVASAILPFVATGLLLATLRADAVWLAVLAWFVPVAVAVLSLLGGVAWRAAEALAVGPFGG